MSKILKVQKRRLYAGGWEAKHLDEVENEHRELLKHFKRSGELKEKIAKLEEAGVKDFNEAWSKIGRISTASHVYNNLLGPWGPSSLTLVGLREIST